jgi:hypothetical protein
VQLNKKMRTASYILLTLIILAGCINQNKHANDYFLFKNKFKKSSYYQQDSKILTEEIYSNNKYLTLIDSIYLLPLNLVDTVNNNKEYGIKRLIDYDCRLLRFIENKKYDCVITCSSTSSAGDGNPIILVSTYNKDGIYLSRAKFDIILRHDYTPVPEQYFLISENNKILMELKEENYELVDSAGTQILKHIKSDYYNESYLINDDGLIMKQTK